MNNQISKNEIEEAFDNLCEQFDYSTDKEVFDSYLFLMQEHQIIFYELLHTPENGAVTTFEQANELSDSFTKKQKKLIELINEKKSCEELKSLFFKMREYLKEFYNLLSVKDRFELKAQIKGLGVEIYKKLEYAKFKEFEYLSSEIEDKHQDLLKSMSKDSSFVKCNLNTKRFEINFSKSKSKKWKGKKR
jgi:hypothetical protein